jgi:hypothetical protein
MTKKMEEKQVKKMYLAVLIFVLVLLSVGAFALDVPDSQAESTNLELTDNNTVVDLGEVAPRVFVEYVDLGDVVVLDVVVMDDRDNRDSLVSGTTLFADIDIPGVRLPTMYTVHVKNTDDDLVTAYLYLTNGTLMIEKVDGAIELTHFTITYMK